MREREQDITTQWEESLRASSESYRLNSAGVKSATITGQMAWKAPEGKAFKITGQFEVSFDQPFASDFWPMPQPSLELLKMQYPKEYWACWIVARGDENKAVKEAEEVPAESISGKIMGMLNLEA